MSLQHRHRHSRLYTTDSASTATTAPQTVTASDQDQATSEKFRKVLRKVPFPVVVVSTCCAKNPTLRRGITISSFSSISLQPIPLVSFCVKLPSRASTVLHESDQFVIQFLSSDQIAHSVAFSSSVAPPPEVRRALSSGVEGVAGAGAGVGQGVKKVPEDKDIEELVAKASRQTMVPSLSNSNSVTSTTTISTTSSTTEPDPFEVLGYDTDPESNLPVLRNTLGAIRCRTHQVMVVGDHEMWIGHVEKVLHGEIPDEKEPLLYHDRSYRHVGRRIL
ncbi:hypothetical protein BGW39_004375 [Mortierella sp. 14UC]|nr:hypothetical protein BGW39_004375 [Mortierella sp. 14UC]